VSTRTHPEFPAARKANVGVGFDPNNFLDSLIEKLHLNNDAALCRALEVWSPVLSKIRYRRSPVSAAMVIRMHEISDLA
jgi:hypothetical protein